MDLEAELERCHADAWGWTLHCCERDAALAEDVLQASYLKILDGRARFGGRSAFRTWLFGVIRRTAGEHRRREALWRWAPLSWVDRRAPAVGAGAEPEAAVARWEAAERLERALKALPRRQRDVLHLVFYQGLTILEAAGVLGVSLGTARTHYERGKAALRARLGKEGER